MTKLVLTDLDRTLLTTDKRISDKSVEVLKKCRDKGILVGFSTSRGYVKIQDYLKQVNPDVVICNDGGNIFYKGEMVFQAVFSVEETRAILCKIFEVCGPEIEITLDTLNKIYYNKKTSESDNYLIGAEYSDFKNFNNPAIKICVKTVDKEAAEKISSAAEAVDAVPFSDIPWYKFTPGTSTKEHAVEFLSEKYKILFAEMIAFGDDFNDIGMLKKCGTGVAMSNAIPEVKAIADAETLSNDEDGVAEFLKEKFQL